ncbi:MAG: PilZ domain-containing protein [Acidobacteriales bacterium]|nr:PilZ domain-containing protein [Terriglobales bacterium]
MSNDQQERRAARRFALHIPLTIVSLGGVPSQRAGRSHDIGTRGICFHCEGELRPGLSVEFVLEMPPEITGGESIRVRCRGQVTRVQREADGSSLLVGARIDDHEYLLATEPGSAAAAVRS